MRGVLIKEKEGFTVRYYPGGEKFLLYDAEGEEVGEGKTQADVESQIKRLQKARAKGKFPIRAFRPDHGGLQEVNITSMNIGDRSIRYTIPGKKREEYGGSHLKDHLWGGHIVAYEYTEKNADIAATIGAKRETIKVLEKEIHGLRDLLEKPIDMTYFEVI